MPPFAARSSSNVGWRLSSSTSPTDRSTIRLASWLISLGRSGVRFFAMPESYGGAPRVLEDPDRYNPNCTTTRSHFRSRRPQIKTDRDHRSVRKPRSSRGRLKHIAASTIITSAFLPGAAIHQLHAQNDAAIFTWTGEVQVSTSDMPETAPTLTILEGGPAPIT